MPRRSMTSPPTPPIRPPSSPPWPRARREHGASAAYGGPAIAAQQQKAYPDIAPLTLPLAPAKAFDLALATARTMPRWNVTASDPASGRIEASQASFWFGFVDDIVIRVTPAGEGSRIDIRSVSRQGKGDLGVNADRVRAYLAALKAAAAAAQSRRNRALNRG